MEGTAASAVGVDVEALHAASTIERVKLAELKIDRSYQRDPSQRLVDDIAENWDEVSSELLLVSQRGIRDLAEESGLFIVNGQHRSLGARKRNLEDVWARVIDLTEVADPAAVEATFRLRTNVRMGDKPLERFKAQVRAGNPESLAIVDILERFDTEVNVAPNVEYGINAVSGVEKLYRVDDGKLLTETLQLIKDTFGSVSGKQSSSAMMVGLSWFILKHAEETDRTRVVEKLNSAGTAAIERRARTTQASMGGALWMNVYRATVAFYNERLQERNQLEWRLKGASTFKGSAGKWGKDTN